MKEDKDSRYFIDLDLKTGKVLDWGHGDRHKLAAQELSGPSQVRIFISKGQYHKLERIG
jgi:hypothetical protein